MISCKPSECIRKDKMHLSFSIQERFQFEIAKISKFSHFDVILHFNGYSFIKLKKIILKLKSCVQFDVMIVYNLLE